MKIRMLLMAWGMVLAGTAIHAAEPRLPEVKYPTDYRSWAHVKSMVIYSDKHPLYASFGGIHHIYVNKVGLKASKEHGIYPDGSVLVFDLLQVNEDNGAYIESSRKVVAVMQKDAKLFKDTGGWGFEGFKGGSPNERVVKDKGEQCFSCHTSQKEHDYVFSTLRN
jgi:hypothetical protein